MSDYDVIETEVSSLDDGQSEQLPIANTEEPGIASFNHEDFLVDINGKVSILKKSAIPQYIAEFVDVTGDDISLPNHLRWKILDGINVENLRVNDFILSVSTDEENDIEASAIYKILLVLPDKNVVTSKQYIGKMINTRALYEYIGKYVDDTINIESGEGTYSLQQKTEKINITPENASGLFNRLHSISGYENVDSIDVGKATGNKGSVALGWQNYAFGERSFAANSLNLVFGERGTAFGTNNIVTGVNAFACGSASVASNTEAIAMGYIVKANGMRSFAIGSETEAANQQSFAGGYQSKSAGTSAFAYGQQTEAIGDFSFATGRQNKAIGKASTTIGGNNTVNSQNATAIGTGNNVTGTSSVALGNANTTTAQNAVAIGNGNTVNGYAGVAIGNGCKVNANYAFACNSATEAEGVASFSAGIGTIAREQSQAVFGYWNADDADALLMVGVGVGAGGRRNAFVVHKDGTIISKNASFENVTITGKVSDVHTEHVYSTNDKITLRYGATTGLVGSQTTGIIANKYDGITDGELVFDNTGTARVGDVGNTQPLATRDEVQNLSDNDILIWDDTNTRVKSSNKTLKNIIGLQNRIDFDAVLIDNIIQCNITNDGNSLDYIFEPNVDYIIHVYLPLVTQTGYLDGKYTFEFHGLNKSNEDIVIKLNNTFNQILGNSCTVEDMRQVQNYDPGIGYSWDFTANFRFTSPNNYYFYTDIPIRESNYSMTGKDFHDKLLENKLSIGSTALITEHYSINGHEYYVGHIYKIISEIIGGDLILDAVDITASALTISNIIIDVPSSTQGTLTNEQLEILQLNDLNYIILNSEIYTLADKLTDVGMLVYSHVGHDSQNHTVIKSISITVSTRGWTLDSLIIGENSKNVTETINSKQISSIFENDGITARNASRDGLGNVIANTYATKTEVNKCMKGISIVSRVESVNSENRTETGLTANYTHTFELASNEYISGVSAASHARGDGNWNQIIFDVASVSINNNVVSVNFERGDADEELVRFTIIATISAITEWK